MIETTRRGRVLVVDDDPLMRQIVMTALAKDNYELLEAGSGAEALEKARADRPDLVLLDVMMPDIDGFEVCLRLRANPTTANVGVVLLTALGEISDKVKGMQIGADDYVTKPFDPRELRSRVDAHFAARAIWAPARSRVCPATRRLSRSCGRAWQAASRWQ